MSIHRIDQVETILASKMVQLIDYVVDDVYEELLNNIVDKAYNQGTNLDYFNGGDRTNQFLESLKKGETETQLRTVIGGIVQNIFTMQLKDAQPFHFWNSHKSMLGEDVRDSMIDILNSSNTGLWNGSREGGFWDDTIKYIDTNLDSIVLKGASKYGIPIKKG